MSTTIEDLKSGTSNCCGAAVYADLGICSDCKEHCVALKGDPDCERCGGIGHYPVQDGPDDFEEVECGCVQTYAENH